MCNETYRAIKEAELKKKLREVLDNDTSHTQEMSRNV